MGLGFRTWDVGFRIWGLVFGIWDLRVAFGGSGLGLGLAIGNPGLEGSCWSLRFKLYGVSV